jgi:hypothetical protein
MLFSVISERMSPIRPLPLTFDSVGQLPIVELVCMVGTRRDSPSVSSHGRYYDELEFSFDIGPPFVLAQRANELLTARWGFPASPGIF